MKDLIIITPVKDSIDTAQKAIEYICKSKGNFEYSVYNDYSSQDTLKLLEKNKHRGYQLINIEDVVETPSPNYRFTLQHARKIALEKEAGLLIIESDVYIQPDTISSLFEFAKNTEDCGMVAAITVDEEGEINFPYKHIIPDGNGAMPTNHRLSFCCTLLTLPLLQKLDFNLLSDKKDWFDVQISKDSRNNGFTNYVLPKVKVIHKPHSSRPWKNLKYTNPLKYYFKKWFSGRDKI